MPEQTTNYTDLLLQALTARKEWLEKSELVKLKEALRLYQSSYCSLYNIFLKKKLINEDPYKQETKISELEVPESTPINEGKRNEQISLRLSNFDSQLDFLVNFYQLGIDFLNLERIKRIVGLIRYIDWVNLTSDSPYQNTKIVAEMATMSRSGVDSITLSIIGESLSRLSKSTATIMGILKDLNTYYRESYKLKIRFSVTQTLPENEVNAAEIKKKMPAALPGLPFYTELIEELIKEDYSSAGAALKEKILHALKVEEKKPKVVKAPVNYKNILLDGIQVIGHSFTALTEIGMKLDENEAVLENRKKGFFEIIKELIRQISNADPEEVVYTLEFLDNTRGIPTKEKINFHQFRDDMNKKIRILNSFVNGPAYQKLSAMPENQIITYLERNIKEVQNMHRTLNALDDFFKANVQQDERS